MALAEIMEAKKELVAQRATERQSTSAEKPKKEDTKPELIQTATEEKKTAPVSLPVVVA